VVGEKVSILPVIGQLNAIEPVAGKQGSELLEIELFFLACIEVVIANVL
jgi:hypothetical protein